MEEAGATGGGTMFLVCSLLNEEKMGSSSSASVSVFSFITGVLWLWVAALEALTVLSFPGALLPNEEKE